jgi:hypothetical protein
MATASCITAIEQNLDRSWTGRSIKTGAVTKFATLDDYKQYVKKLEDKGTFCADIEPIYSNQYTPGKSTQNSGFLEFQARDPVGQSKFSAMSPSWEGIASSDAAIARGEYDLEKKPQKTSTPPKEEPSWNCAIQ